MDTYDLSHKLAYAGARSPIPFITGPEYTNSVSGVPVLSELRIFIQPEQWTEENVKLVAREISRVLGATSQFDIGITIAGVRHYSSTLSVAGSVARLSKMDPDDPTVSLRYRHGAGDELYQARFPSLRFDVVDEHFWQEHFAPGAVKSASHV